MLQKPALEHVQHLWYSHRSVVGFCGLECCRIFIDACAAFVASERGCGALLPKSACYVSPHCLACRAVCCLLSAVARFVEALLAAGRPATALAVQRARCAGGGGSSSSSLREAEVLLRVQLGCGLLAEAFCDLRRHCSQVRGAGVSGLRGACLILELSFCD